jgi:hypothetical protein
VLAAVEPDALEDAFSEWVSSLRKENECDITAIDGKVARGSRCAGGRGANIVSAYACAERLVLGQLACDEKSNEIVAIPKLIEKLHLKCPLATPEMPTCHHRRHGDAKRDCLKDHRQESRLRVKRKG